MKSINVVALSGNLASDPELRHTQSGAAVCTLRLANSVRRKRGEGWGDRTSFFDIEVWGGQAAACAEHLRQGSRVAVQGEIEIDEWRDRDGQRRTRAVIRQAAVTFEGARPRGEEKPEGEPASAEAVASEAGMPF